MLSSVTVRLSRRGGHQPRRQLFAKHFAEILFHFAFQRGQKSFSGIRLRIILDGGRAQIARGIAGAPRDRDHRIFRLRDLEQTPPPNASPLAPAALG